MIRSEQSTLPSLTALRCRSEIGIGALVRSHVASPTGAEYEQDTVLNVSYRTKELKVVCISIEEAQSQLGPQPAAELHELLAEAESFHTADELIEFRSGEIVGGDSLSFSFGTHYRAAFNAVGDNLPREANGSVAWGQVRRIMLIEISQ